MEGVAPELFSQHSPEQWAEWLTNRPGTSECRLIFKRPDSDDLTSPIGSYQFQNMVRKGFVAVAIADDDRAMTEGRVPNPLDTFPRKDRA